jgi:hypothetical protein
MWILFSVHLHSKQLKTHTIIMCQNCNSPIKTHKDGVNAFCGRECALHFKCKQLLESDDSEKSELAARTLERRTFMLDHKEFVDAFALKVRSKVVEGSCRYGACKFLVPYLYGFMTYTVPATEEDEYQALKRIRKEVADCSECMTEEDHATLSVIASGIGCHNY